MVMAGVSDCGAVGLVRRSRSHLTNDPMIITVMKVPTLEMRAAIQWIHWKGLLKVRVFSSLRASCCCRARISICWRTSSVSNELMPASCSIAAIALAKVFPEWFRKTRCASQVQSKILDVWKSLE